MAPCMLGNFRYASRTLRQNPGFTATAIVSIALAIGANSAIFSMADGLLFRPMPVPDASNVVSIRARMPSGNVGGVSYPDFIDFRDKSRSFESLIAYELIPTGFAKDAQTQPQLKMGYLVTGNIFQSLRIAPQFGRPFEPDEDQVPGRDAVMVLSHDLWKSEFAEDPSAVGRHVRLNDLDFVIIAVMPESFPGIDHLFRPAFYVPIAMGPKLATANHDLLTNRSMRDFSVKGRLAGNVSIQAADAEIAALARSLAESNPATNRAVGAAVRTESQLRVELDPAESQLIAFLFALVIVVLSIACANVANLTLNRGRARSREIAVRLAVGASRWRIVGQLMAESLLIALAGGALGLILTEYAVVWFSGIEVPGDLPIQFSFKLDYRVLVFTVVASMVSAVLFGLAPALQSLRIDLITALKSGESDSARKRLLGRRALVVVQIAGSVVLVAAAAQLYRGLESALYSNHGFRTDHRITMRVAPAEAGYSTEQTVQFYRTLLERVRNNPGVKSAALASRVPMTTPFGVETVIPEGYRFPAGQENARVLTDYVGDSYFETFGVPILEGRGFSPADREGSPRVAVVNEQFGRHFLNGNPVGKRLRIDPNGAWIEIVGMTVTGQHLTVFEPQFDFMYLPFSQSPQQRMTLIAETSGAPASMSEPLRQVVRSIDPNMPVFAVRTMDDLFDQRSVKIAHMFSGIVASLGGMGLVLALVGLYAVVAYQVGRKTREIGIRMALGAGRPQVVTMILKNAATLAVTGVVIGSLVCIAANGALSVNLLGPQVVRLSPALFVGIVAVLLATTLLAAAIPARRASRIDPQRALRQE